MSPANWFHIACLTGPAPSWMAQGGLRSVRTGAGYFADSD